MLGGKERSSPLVPLRTIIAFGSPDVKCLNLYKSLFYATLRRLFGSISRLSEDVRFYRKFQLLGRRPSSFSDVPIRFLVKREISVINFQAQRRECG